MCFVILFSFHSYLCILKIRICLENAKKKKFPGKEMLYGYLQTSLKVTLLMFTSIVVMKRGRV